MKYLPAIDRPANGGQTWPKVMSLPSGMNLPRGMSLIELLLAVALSSMLTLTLVSIAMAARNSFRLQESLAELQENSRYFADLLTLNIADNGFHPNPWLHELTPIGLMPDSADASSLNSDRLVSRSWSDRNCFGTLNPVLADSGEPEFHLRETLLESVNGNLTQSCRYGPAADAMITQVNRQGVLPQVEVFQVLFAKDTNADGLIDRWVQAGDWADTRELLAVRLGILSSSRESVTSLQSKSHRILDFDFQAPADGRLRRVSSYTLPLQPLLP
jgi:type II secretory pathway pseudopilin PulG